LTKKTSQPEPYSNPPIKTGKALTYPPQKMQKSVKIGEVAYLFNEKTHYNNAVGSRVPILKAPRLSRIDSAKRTYQTPYEDPNTLKDSRKLKDPGKGPAFFVNKIILEGNSIFDDKTLAPLVDIGEGSDMTLGILSLYSQEIRAYYASRGFILARAYVPEQEVINNVIKIVIEEGKIGNITVRGNREIRSSDILAKVIQLKYEPVITEKNIESVLLLLNDSLGIKASSVFKPSATTSATDLVLEIEESAPYTVGLDGDNFGSEFTGRNRYGVSVSRGNLLELGDLLSVRGVQSDLDQQSFQASYNLPINNVGSYYSFSYLFSEQTLGESLSELNAGGDSHFGSLSINHPLYRSRKGSVEVRLGSDYRNFKNFVLDTLSSKDSLIGVPSGIGGNIQDRFGGYNYFDLNLHHGFTETDKNRDLASRAQGVGDATTFLGNYSRYQLTGLGGSSFYLKTTGQWASERLLSPDLFSIGGSGTVRGFPLAELTGDNGYLVSVEYSLPMMGSFNLGNTNYKLSQYLSVYGFIDHGRVLIIDNQDDESNDSITGGGGGIKLTFPQKTKWFPSLSLGASYALPLTGPDPTDRRDGVLYVNGSVSYGFEQI
jgi:hemolysin activation/secretion protein